MPGGRSTNNSVSSLEEKDLPIEAMAEKTGSSVKVSTSSKEKKAKKPRASSTQTAAAAAAAALAPEQPVPGGSRDNVSIPDQAVPESGDVVGDGGAQALPSLLQPQVVPNPNPMGQEGFPLPYFYPPQLYGRSLGYSGLGQNFVYPDYGPMDAQSVQSEDPWETRSGVSTGGGRQATHQMSDEEDEEITEVQSVKAPKMDFTNLKSGRMAEILKQRHEKTHGGEKLGPQINETLAGTINDFYVETKVNIELEKLAKDYPRVENVPRLCVPKLDVELFPAVDQTTRQNDVALQNLQKGLVGAISAMAPVASLMVNRGDADSELEDLCGNMVDAMQMVALVDLGLTNRRRELIKPSMQQTYARALAKGPSGSPEWLYGGNLSQEAKKCEDAKRVAEKVMKRKNTQGPQQNASAAQSKGVGRGQNKKFRFQQPGNKQQHYQPRGYQGYSQVFPAPVPVYQQQYQQYPQQFQFQDYRQKSQRQNNQQAFAPQQQDFQKRGPKK